MLDLVKKIITCTLITSFLIICISFLQFFYYCIRKDHFDIKQKEYHEGFEEIEQAVLAEYSDYIVFEEPIINEEEKSIEWGILLRRPYIRSHRKLSKQNPYELIESVRNVINQTITSGNGNSFFSDYKVEIVFWKPNEIKWSTDEPSASSIVVLYNYCPYHFISSDHSAFYGCFNCVELYNVGRWDSSWGEDYFQGGQFLKGASDIKELYFIDYYTVEDIISVIDNTQDVEYVVVGTDNLDELRELRPDISFN